MQLITSSRLLTVMYALLSIPAEVSQAMNVYAVWAASRRPQIVSYNQGTEEKRTLKGIANIQKAMAKLKSHVTVS